MIEHKNYKENHVCKQKLKIVSDNLNLRTKEVEDKDLIIDGLEKQKQNLNQIIKDDAEVLKDQIKISNTFEKDLSKQKKTTFIYKLFSLLGIVSTTLLILKH
jgi:vacuolar-type H+-ATPase subunit I/STV1